MIVGHKIEQYLTGVQRFGGGGYYEITTHRRVTELHATKGWRLVRHVRHIQRVRKLPPIDKWRAANITTFERMRRPGPVGRRLDWLDTISPAARERAVMRHKVRRVEAQRAKNLARLASNA